MQSIGLNPISDRTVWMGVHRFRTRRECYPKIVGFIGPVLWPCNLRVCFMRYSIVIITVYAFAVVITTIILHVLHYSSPSGCNCH